MELRAQDLGFSLYEPLRATGLPHSLLAAKASGRRGTAGEKLWPLLWPGLDSHPARYFVEVATEACPGPKGGSRDSSLDGAVVHHFVRKPRGIGEIKSSLEI